MRLTHLRRMIRNILQEEIGRNFHTVNTDPISYKDFANYEVDIIMTSDDDYITNIFYKGDKLTATRVYPTREEAELSAQQTVEKHRIDRFQEYF